MNTNLTKKANNSKAFIFCLFIGVFLTAKNLPAAITGIRVISLGGGISTIIVLNIICAILGIVNILLFFIILIRRLKAAKEAA